jgi:hypothetical protein
MPRRGRRHIAHYHTKHLRLFSVNSEKPFNPGQRAAPPTPEDMERLRTLATEHNYWMAAPPGNAAIGLRGF